MRTLHEAALDWQATLRRIRSLNGVQAPAWTSGDPGLDIFAAVVAVDSVEATSGALAGALNTAAEGYARAERQAEGAARVMAAGLGWAVGRFSQLAALVALSAMPALTAGAVIWLFRQALDQGAGSPRDPRLLTSPLAAALVRAAVSSLDDVAVGALGMPLPVACALGDDGAGLLGVTTSAAGLLAAIRPHGLLRETPVSVARVGPMGRPNRATVSTPSGAVAAPVAPPGPSRSPDVKSASPVMVVSPPVGLADLASRIPDLSVDGGQVRIERYGDAGAAAWVVYIGGTVEWGPVAATEPWDLTSNLTMVANQEAGSYRAVVQAMREAGIQPGEPVIEVGHSQGGLIAAQVAAAGVFTTVATLTFGAPSGHVPVLATVNTVAVEHTDDIVPGMGGTSEGAAARLLVRREVYASEPIPDTTSLPAHSMANYAHTARLIDSSPEPRLRAFRDQLTSVVGSSAGIAAVWRGTRSPAGPDE